MRESSDREFSITARSYSALSIIIRYDTIRYDTKFALENWQDLPV